MVLKGCIFLYLGKSRHINLKMDTFLHVCYNSQTQKDLKYIVIMLRYNCKLM